jgi:ATP-dependent RNA circularization protein (DNA/RNA ligase family)
MSDFFRFPHTPHLAWLGKGQPRDDKVLDPKDVAALLSGLVVVEEKVDGANLGVSLTSSGELRAQNRGSYLERPFRGQFSRLDQWMMERYVLFQEHLPAHLILFGEWCAARHSLGYEALPDWFVLFDVYDRGSQKFWSVDRRNGLAETLQLPVVPVVFQGKATVAKLERLVVQLKSRYRDGSAEGIVVRKDSAKWCQARAKLVHPDFTQNIGEHWRSRAIDWNAREPDSPYLHPTA